MGRLIHHAIVVTSISDTAIEAAHTEATRIYAQASPDPFSRPYLGLVTPVAKVVVNSGGSFLVAPDGSKEGWEESDHGDLLRYQLTSWLDAQRDPDDGSSSLEWCEIIVGGDIDGPTITQTPAGHRVRP